MLHDYSLVHDNCHPIPPLYYYHNGRHDHKQKKYFLLEMHMSNKKIKTIINTR